MENNFFRKLLINLFLFTAQGDVEPVNTTNVNSSNLSLQQRIFAHHTRHLPSRRIGKYFL